MVADAQWCRARVLKPADSSGLIAIRYVDFGEEALLNPAQLRPITAASLRAKLPSLAIPCAATPKLFPSPSGALSWSPESKAYVEEQFPVFASIKVEVVQKSDAGILSVVAKREDGVSLADLLMSSGHATDQPPSVPAVSSAKPSPPQEVVMADLVPSYPMESLRGKENFSSMIPHMTDWQNLFVQPFTDENQLHMIKVNDEITKVSGI